MTEKNLTELEWKKFSKGKGLKDAAFVKALAELDKAERAKDIAAQLKAYDEIEKQADALRKANKGEKEVSSYFDDVDKALSKDRKLAELAAKQAAKAQKEAEEAESEDEEETPDILTTKMIPLMRMVRKGDVMKVMVATTGKDTVVLISRKPIGPPRRKLLANHLGATGGVKYLLGECLWEENANTFVMQTQAAGLAKKIKAALLAQTETRYKVRVRGEDGEVDDDGEPAEDGEQQGGGTIPEAPPMPQAKTTTEDKPAESKDVELQMFEDRANALAEAAKAAAAGGDDRPKLKISEARTFSRKKEFAQAEALLDETEKLLSDAFKARLTALIPKIKEMTAAKSDKAAEMNALVTEAGGFARKREFVEANELLHEAEVLAGLAKAPTVESEGGEDEDEDEDQPKGPKTTEELRAAFNKRLAAMLPRAKEAIAAGNAEIKNLVTEAGGLARVNDFEAANQMLDEVKLMLDEAGGGESESEEDDQAADAPWQARLADVQPRYLELLKTNPGNAGTLRAVMDYATAQAGDKQYDKAIGALQRLEKMMAESKPAEDTGHPGIVAYRTSLLEFRKAAAQVTAQIASLKAAIPSQLPEQAELADELADTLDEFNEDLLDTVDEAISAAKDEAEPVNAALAARIEAYLGELKSHPLVKHADGNPFGVKVTIAALLGAALSDIKAKMPEPV